jgi:hypothetical protein
MLHWTQLTPSHASSPLLRLTGLRQLVRWDEHVSSLRCLAHGEVLLQLLGVISADGHAGAGEWDRVVGEVIGG